MPKADSSLRSFKVRYIENVYKMSVVIQYERDSTYATEVIPGNVWSVYEDFLANHHVEIPLNLVGVPRDNGFLSVSQFLHHIKIFNDHFEICKLLLPKSYMGTFRLLDSLETLKNSHRCTRNCWM